MAITDVKAVINGQEYILTYNSTDGTYQATINAPSKSSFKQTGGYYNVSVTAQDNAGNSTTVDASDITLGDNLKLVVKEKVAPVIANISIASGATLINNTPEITFEVTDNDSGVKSGSLKIDGTAVSGLTKTAITNGYKYSYTPSSALADGSHTIAVGASDNDGNAATEVSVSFKVDTTPPVLNVTAPTNDSYTNQTKINVVGVTNDTTSSPVTVKIGVNGTDSGTVTVKSDGSFTKEITLREGANTITITSTDKAGKASTVTRTVNLNTVAPVFESVEIVPNPVDAGETYIIKVKVS